MKGTILILGTALALASCAGSGKVAKVKQDQGVTERKKLSCADVHVPENTPHIDWYEENKSVLEKSDEMLVLPKNYKVYSLDSAQVVAFFNSIQGGSSVSTVLPLPAPANCQLFSITYDRKEGAKLPPGLIVAAGEGQGQKAMLNWYRGNLTAHITWFGLQYEMMTITAAGEPYILVYEKMPPPPNPKKNNEENVPEIIELRYDK